MRVIIKPLVTEKMTAMSEKSGKYGFAVEKDATKHEIKLAVEKMYNVNVKDVNTMIYAGKTKVKNTKKGVQVGRTASYKKAIVKLAEGQKIDFYSNI